MGRSASSAWVAAAACAIAPACREPTEIEIEVTTDVKCSDAGGVAVTVGTLGALESSPPTSTSAACDDATGRVGTLVVVPSAAVGSVGIRVVMGFGRAADQCVPPFGMGCIVARRAINFVPHSPLRVPVAMQAVCNGVPCGATETCAGGQCIPATDASAGDAGSGGTGIACPSDARGLQQGAAYPMPDWCPSRSNQSPYIGPAANTVRWTGPPAEATPVIGRDGTVYASSSSKGATAAVDPATGKARWQIGNAGNLLLASDGTLYLAAGSALVAVDAATGQMRWQRALAARDLNVASDGTLYVSTGGNDGHVHAVDPASRADRWVSHDETSDVAIAPDGSLYAGEVQSSAEGAFAIDPVDGHTRWSRQLGGSGGGAGSTVAVAPDGTVLCSTNQSGLAALDPATGGVLWKFDDGGKQTSTGIAVSRDGVVVVGTMTGVAAVDLATGHLRWRYATGGGTPADPLIDARGDVYAASWGGYALYAIDGSSGALRWQAPAGGAPDNSPALGADGTIYLVRRDGSLVALGP